MQKGKFNVVTDGQFGSCGKGLVTSALAYRQKPEILSTTNLPNAGHSAVNADGTVFVAKAIPSASILNKWLSDYKPQIVIGGSAAFHLDRLLYEVEECGINDSIVIHQRAGVVTKEHQQSEAGGDRSTKHIASTMQGSGAFQADKLMRKQGLKLARDYQELEKIIFKMDISMPEWLSDRMQQGHTILHEGSQGYSLDINHGQSYPFCTSRGTTAIQNMADMGISPKQLGDVYLVIRPYPIRVGNVVENGEQTGFSGGCYYDQQETTWQQVAKEAGMPDDVAETLTKKELTTVTKRLRRVFTFSETQLKQAALVNGATRIVLNFANYIDYSVYGVDSYDKLTDKVKRFIETVEKITGVPVTMIGTGPQVDHVVMI